MRRILPLFMCIVLISLLFMVLVVTAQTQCPSTCSCMLPSDAAKQKGYTLCGGKQVVCGYDKTQNPLYCYQKPATAATTSPTTTATTVKPASQSACPSPCSCMLPSEAKAGGFAALCGGKQVVCGYDQQQNAKYCYEKPATKVPIVTTIKPTTTPTTFTRTPCPSACACLLPDSAKKMGYTFCGGKQTICGYDTDKSPLYCYAPSATPTTVPVTPTVTTIETLPTTRITILVTTTRDSTGSPTPSPVTTIVPVIASGEDMEPTVLETAPSMGINQQEHHLGGISGFINAIMSFFGSLFGRSPPPQSTREQRVICNGILTDLMSDPDNCGSCGVTCDSGSCVAGRCTDDSGRMITCGPLQVTCDGVCRSIMSDEHNCGSCGNVCTPPYQQCCSGRCIRPCEPGEVCIEGACRDTSSDNMYCGVPWERCDDPSVCCDGACRNLNDDEQNCGMCGWDCWPGFTCCNGRCADLSNFDNNCGACGNRCPGDEMCCEGTCCDTSARDITCCWDGCTDIWSDRNNCGRCGHACPDGEACYGMCLAVDQARTVCWNEFYRMLERYREGEITDREYWTYYASREDCDSIGT